MTWQGLITGEELHQSFVRAANEGGAWVPYPWRNGADEPVYNKIAYIVKVVRGGENYYLGVGLADNLWSTVGRVENQLAANGGPSRWLDGCSPDQRHPCSEDWAHHVSGLMLRQILTAKDYSELASRVKSPLNASSSPFGFQAHIHNDQVVLADGYLPRYVGNRTTDWLRAVQLDRSNLAGCRSTGAWLVGGAEGAFNLRLREARTGAQRFFLYCISVPVSDLVADGIEDGAFDTLTVLVAVSAGSPMPSLVLEDRCLERPYGDWFSVVGTPDIICRDDVDIHQRMCNADIHGVCQGDNSGWTQTSRSDCVQKDRPEGYSETGSLTCMCTPEYDLRFADEQPLTSACEAETVGPIVYKLQATYAPFCALRYPPFPIGAVLGPIFAVIAIAILIFIYLQWRKRKQLAALKEQLKAFAANVTPPPHASRPSHRRRCCRAVVSPPVALPVSPPAPPALLACAGRRRVCGDGRF